MLPISCGVAQCSFLGPLLLILYTTPLSSLTQSHNRDHHLYADDTHIYVSLTTPGSSKPCRCYFYHIRDLRRIRRFISLSVAITNATALISKLDYCNFLLYNAANKDTSKRQRVQNCLTRVLLVFLAQCRF